MRWKAVGFGMYVYFSDLAEAWTKDREAAKEDVLQEFLSGFWLGQFEKLGDADTVGTVLGKEHFSSVQHFDEGWVGQSISRRTMLHDILGTVTGLPMWGRWAEDGADPDAREWTRLSQIEGKTFSDGPAYLNLSKCPLDFHTDVAREFLLNLALEPHVVARWFERRNKSLTPNVAGLLDRVRSAYDPAAPEEAPGDGGTQRIRFSRTQLDTWYKDRVAQHESDGTIPSRDDDVRAAQQQFGANIPRSVIRDLCRQHAPTGWTKGGRRPASKS